MEWTSEAISVWWWARRDVPADVASGQPNPKSWAIPVAHFTGCDFDALFQNHQIVRWRMQRVIHEKAADRDDRSLTSPSVVTGRAKQQSGDRNVQPSMAARAVRM